MLASNADPIVANENKWEEEYTASRIIFCRRMNEDDKIQRNEERT